MRQLTSSTYRGGFGPFHYRLTPWVKRLILANAVVSLLVWTRALDYRFVVDHFGFNVSQVLTEPWTIITYMFVHDSGFLHVFLNMLMLFFFGPPLEERWGGKEFIKYYTICGVGGAVFSLYMLTFGGGTIIGASGAVFGVMLAYALNWPDSLVWIYAIFPIKVKYLVIFLGAISFFSAFAPGGATDGVAHFAHLGGLVVGYVYLKKGWQVQARWQGLNKRLRKRRLKVVNGGPSAPERRGRTGGSEEEARILEVVDKLLDKIAEQGIDSLTPEERRFLDEVSRRRQARHEVRH